MPRIERLEHHGDCARSHDESDHNLVRRKVRPQSHRGKQPRNRDPLHGLHVRGTTPPALRTALCYPCLPRRFVERPCQRWYPNCLRFLQLNGISHVSIFFLCPIRIPTSFSRPEFPHVGSAPKQRLLRLSSSHSVRGSSRRSYRSAVEKRRPCTAWLRFPSALAGYATEWRRLLVARRAISSGRHCVSEVHAGTTRASHESARLWKTDRRRPDRCHRRPLSRRLACPR